MANQYTPFRFISDTHKECSLCEKIKEHSEFHKDKRSKRGLGLSYYCKECANKKSRDLHKSRQNDLEYKKEKKSQYLKAEYGLTLEEYIHKIETQKYCAICKDKLKGIGTYTHLDHCHKTGKNRDFLCSNCNRGIGCFHDSIEKLKSAIEYLKKHSSNVD